MQKKVIVQYLPIREKVGQPIKGTKFSAGTDLINPERVMVKPGRNVIPMGFAMSFPEGYEAEIMSRSGMSAKGMLGYSVPYTTVSKLTNEKFGKVKDAPVSLWQRLFGKHLTIRKKIGIVERRAFKNAVRMDVNLVDWDDQCRFDADVITGKVDSDYRGEIGVIVYSKEIYPFWLEAGERIAQLTIRPVESLTWKKVKELPESERSNGGFGSTTDAKK